MLKSSNFVKLSYKRFLAEYDINHCVFACGYYNKLNLFHNYELFHKMDSIDKQKDNSLSNK